MASTVLPHLSEVSSDMDNEKNEDEDPKLLVLQRENEQLKRKMKELQTRCTCDVYSMK